VVASTAKVLPSVERYLEELPNGADSYPHCRIKGSVVVSILTTCGLPLPFAPGLVPPEAEVLTREMPSVNDWVPEVHYATLSLAVREQRFPGPEGLHGFDQWVLDENKRLLTGPLYRVLFMVASPERIVRAGGERWGRFHRGSTLSVRSEAKGRVTGRLTYPEKLFPPLTLRGFAMALRAAAEAAGAEGVSASHHVKSETSTEYELAWK
jgi:hypothetical protein